jgi:hypothetical protein
MTKPVAQSALQELLALAERTRPDLDREALKGVLEDRAYDRIGWPLRMLHTVRMLAQGEDLRMLRDAMHDPTKPRVTR